MIALGAHRPREATSASVPDHHTPTMRSILKPMAAASLTATWFITPQPQKKIQSGLA